ncbi:uncharacterized protein PAC_08075 [Phialocephala subalpina]|uniref:Survival protein SurE-like phosphatase/nucleotidase domain-containing protein n=1 Tax=Phialocephala subalpina TaxID=576137 RepID=A0A1L7WZI9_9HELO|nr:uncharacterized protein PAC_08075 [Phialocephala subalpina]
MRFSHIRSAVAASAITMSAVNGLNTLVTNDDGFGASNIREMYKAIKAFGHNVYIIASTSIQSGTGGTVVFTNRNLTADTEFAVERGIPGIAFSARYSVQTPYYYVNSTTVAGLKDPATIAGELAANLAHQTGGADFDSAIFNSTTGLFSYANVVPAGANQCIDGDCSLPGETNILDGGCQSSVSVFTVDYDAPTQCHNSPDVRSLLLPLVQYANSSKLVGGLNGTTGVYGGVNGTSGTATGTGVRPTSTYTGPITDARASVELP